MTPARKAFEDWKKVQTFYSADILELTDMKLDHAGNVLAWHPALGVLKTIPLPTKDASEVMAGRT